MRKVLAFGVAVFALFYGYVTVYDGKPIGWLAVMAGAAGLWYMMVKTWGKNHA